MSAAAFYGNGDRNFTRSEVLRILMGLQGRSCSICGGYMSRMDMTIDHVVPRGRGGVHDWNNWLLAHTRCNHDKGDGEPTDRQIKMLGAVQAKLFPKPNP